MNSTPEHRGFLTMQTKLEHLSFFMLALLLLFSSFVVSYHWHLDAQTRSTCAVCRSSQDIDAGDSSQPPSPVRQESAFFSFAAEISVKTTEPLTLSGSSRAPPRHFITAHIF
jgi:hypothetical protein